MKNKIFSDLSFPRNIPMDIEPRPKPVEYWPTQPIPLKQALDIIENSKGDE